MLILVTLLQFSISSAEIEGEGKEPVMETLACRAVTQAGLVAVTASLDDHSPEPLLFVAGWLTTAADLMLQSALLRVGSDLDVLL